MATEKPQLRSSNESSIILAKPFPIYRGCTVSVQYIIDYDNQRYAKINGKIHSVFVYDPPSKHIPNEVLVYCTDFIYRQVTVDCIKWTTNKEASNLMMPKVKNYRNGQRICFSTKWGQKVPKPNATVIGKTDHDPSVLVVLYDNTNEVALESCYLAHPLNEPDNPDFAPINVA